MSFNNFLLNAIHIIFICYLLILIERFFFFIFSKEKNEKITHFIMFLVILNVILYAGGKYLKILYFLKNQEITGIATLFIYISAFNAVLGMGIFLTFIFKLWKYKKSLIIGIIMFSVTLLLTIFLFLLKQYYLSKITDFIGCITTSFFIYSLATIELIKQYKNYSKENIWVKEFFICALMLLLFMYIGACFSFFRLVIWENFFANIGFFFLVISVYLTRTWQYSRQYTELKIQKQIDIQQKHLIQTIVNVKHDERTSLTNTKNSLDIIEKKIKNINDDDFKRAVEIVKREICKQIRFDDNIVDSYKYDKGFQVYENKSVRNFSSILNDEIRNFFYTAKNKGLKINAKVENEIYVKADKRLINKILSNLISNAIKYTEKGHIDVELLSKKNMLVFSISDTGQGLSKQRISDIYDRYKLLGEKKRKNEGIGLGLLNVIDAVNNLNGKFNIHSIEGKGSIFTIILPRYTKKETDIVINSYELTHTDTYEDIVLLEPINKPGRPWLLILDDDERILSDLVYSLNYKVGAEFNLYMASSVNEAIRVIDDIGVHNKEYPAVIISDLSMDENDGDEFVEKMKYYEGFRSIPVIFLTAKIDDESISKGLKHAISYVKKPFNIDHLVLQIKSIINTLYYFQQENSILQNNDRLFENRCYMFKISGKQKEVLQLLLSGYLQNEIAVKLNIGSSTVGSHIERIYEKLGLVDGYEKNEKRLKLFETFKNTSF